ncbi:MAG: hypothetical protein KDD36_08525 [Flavobacteriales bacterium]|nr:hypothetical protein [Flavobacteriales bacterium]
MKQGLILRIAYAVLICLVWVSCKKSVITPPAIHMDYFPVDVGHWVEYEMDSTVYDAFFNGKDTSYHYYIREEITETFTDLEGHKAYRIQRSRRDSLGMPWQITDIWYANRDEHTGERVEENVRYVNLVFPPDKKVRWDGNALNTRPKWEFRYEKIHSPADLGAIHFDSTVTVLQIDEANLIEQQYAQEIYAKGVGLVYRKQHYLETEVDGTIIGGYDFTFKVINWGK